MAKAIVKIRQRARIVGANELTFLGLYSMGVEAINIRAVIQIVKITKGTVKRSSENIEEAS